MQRLILFRHKYQCYRCNIVRYIHRMWIYIQSMSKLRNIRHYTWMLNGIDRLH